MKPQTEHINLSYFIKLKAYLRLTGLGVTEGRPFCFCFVLFCFSVFLACKFWKLSPFLSTHTVWPPLSCPFLKLDSRLCNRYSDTKPVNLKYAFSSFVAIGISDTTIGCNSKLVVWQDPSVVAIMPKGELKSNWRSSEGAAKCSSHWW